MEVRRVPTADNIADPLTKLLRIKHHDRHVRGMGIRYIEIGSSASGRLLDLGMPKIQSGYCNDIVLMYLVIHIK